MKLIDEDKLLEKLADVVADKTKSTTGERRFAKRMIRTLAKIEPVNPYSILTKSLIPFNYEGEEGLLSLQYGDKIIVVLSQKQMKKALKDPGYYPPQYGGHYPEGGEESR